MDLKSGFRIKLGLLLASLLGGLVIVGGLTFRTSLESLYTITYFLIWGLVFGFVLRCPKCGEHILKTKWVIFGRTIILRGGGIPDECVLCGKHFKGESS